ncbi:RsmB/NOP family class I SAM-dependent RNA methyltransferase [Paenibacillus algicola]|nr:RsmB/NOP family class I SAM-dependent RNA methyltransferase [Paenibacillus algicola]
MAPQRPSAFDAKMKSLLGDDFEQFQSSYNDTPLGGLRVNTLKISREAFQKQSPFALTPIPWCETGFYTGEGVRPGLHPYYHAGMYYIQEPSAMAPVELLNVEPGDRVLDLCAAPGGKSTQIAAKLAGRGHLVTNDLHPERTKALAKNIELYGVRNAVVLNEAPEAIAASFPEYFNKILIDAPCSGEGMFRKDEDMLRHWTEDSPRKYAAMQKEILESAARMLAPGGTMVYSTCTFSPEENEGMIAVFLKHHPEFSLLSKAGTEAPWFSAGESQWLSEHGLEEAGPDAAGDAAWMAEISKTLRLWPHRVKGEGHFMAVLCKEVPEMAGASHREEGYRLSLPVTGVSRGQLSMTLQAGGERRQKRLESIHASTRPEAKHQRGASAGMDPGGRRGFKGGRGSERVLKQDTGTEIGREEAEGLLQRFISDNLSWEEYHGYLRLHGQHLYLSPLPEERLQGLKVVRAGWYVGSVKHGRFQPSHPLAAALQPEEARRVINLSSDSGEAVRYLKGETLEIAAGRVHSPDFSSDEPKGYVLITIDGCSAGWGKWQSGILKNEYPAAWRWTSA